MNRSILLFATIIIVSIPNTGSVICLAGEAVTIIDNMDARTWSTGSWQASGGAKPYGSNSVYSKDTGSTFTFTADLAEAEYGIYMYWTGWPSRMTKIPVTVSSNAGQSASYLINQQTAPSQWSLLGTVTLGTNSRVTITSPGGGSTNADAVKFVQLTQPEPSQFPDSTGPLNLGCINVKDFGAPGDGTDQTQAIQSAIDSLSGSGVVFLPEGVYVISSTITIPKGVMVGGIYSHYTSGYGTRIESQVYGGACFRMGDGVTISTNAGIRNMRISASSGYENGTGIDLCYTRWCEVENVFVKGFSGAGGAGIRLSGQPAGPSASMQATVKNVYLSDNMINLYITGQSANNGSGHDESIFTNVRIQPSSLANSVGIQLEKGSNNTFRNVVISNNASTAAGTKGIYIANGGAVNEIYAASCNTFINTAIEKMAVGIELDSFAYENTFINTRIHAEQTYPAIKDASGGGNRFIGLSGGENLVHETVHPLPANPTNMLLNGEFERWEAGTTGSPSAWVLTGAGATAAQSTDSRKGKYSAALSISSDGRLGQSLPDFDHLAGRYVTFACWVKADYTISTARAVRLGIDDGTGSTMGKEHTGGGEWELLSVRRKIDDNASKVEADIDIVNAPGTITIDQAIMVEGLEVPLPADRPIMDSGRLLASCVWEPEIMAGDGETASTTITCNGASVGDPVMVSLTNIGANDVLISGYVDQNDRVRVVLVNKSGGLLDLEPGTLNAMVFKYGQ